MGTFGTFRQFKNTKYSRVPSYSSKRRLRTKLTSPKTCEHRNTFLQISHSLAAQRAKYAQSSSIHDDRSTCRCRSWCNTHEKLTMVKFIRPLFATMVQSVAGDYNKLRWHFTPRRSPVYSLLLLLFWVGGGRVPSARLTTTAATTRTNSSSIILGTSIFLSFFRSFFFFFLKHVTSAKLMFCWSG